MIGSTSDQIIGPLTYDTHFPVVSFKYCRREGFPNIRLQSSRAVDSLACMKSSQKALTMNPVIIPAIAPARVIFRL